MSDSPLVKAPLDPKEQPILDKLLITRDALLLLKQDKTKYVRSEDVIKYYDQIIDQVSQLNELRSDGKRIERSRVDSIVEDCLQLISLFFLTIGRNNEIPAAYSVVSTIKRLLSHLEEAGFFTGKDLKSLCEQLEKVQTKMDRDRADHSPHLLLLLDAHVEDCRATITRLKATLSQLSPELTSVHERLVSILRTLSGLNIKSKKKPFPVEEVKDFQKQLKDIEENLDGHPHALAPSDLSLEDQYTEKLKSVQDKRGQALPGMEVVLDLLGRCMLWAEISLQRQGKMDERFQDMFESLSTIRTQLDRLSLTQAWSLRETDLYGYQRKLDRFDEARVNGNFVDADGKPADIYEQRGLLYLLRKSYATIYHMITSSEPVSEALLPIYNQLLTLKTCLVEVRRSGGVTSPRELYPYSMKLNSIDNIRVDGKFIVNGDVPEGQASVTALLSECFEMAYELRNEAEGEAPDESSDDNQDNDKEKALSLGPSHLSPQTTNGNTVSVGGS